jgi:hypothetical protein
MKNQALLFSLIILLLACKKEDHDSKNIPTNYNYSFEKTYGGDKDDFAKSILEKDDFIYVYGITNSFSDVNGNHYLIKLDKRGNLIYEQSFGSPVKEEASKIIATRDGNLLLLGNTYNTSTGNQDINLLKIDLDGNFLWEKTYGGDKIDFANDIIETKNGQFLITGATTSFGKGSSDIYLLWVEQNGDLIKEVVHGEIDQDGGTAAIELANNDLMVFGYTWNYGGISRDYYLLKMNSNGDSLWSKRYGGDEYEETQAFEMTTEGHFILNGHSASTDPLHNMLGIKVDKDGNELWSQNFGGALHDGGMAFKINSRGNYVFVGRSMSYGGNQNILIVTTTPSGLIISEDIIGKSGADMANEIIEYEFAYYLAGQSTSFGNGDLDMYVVRHPF